MEGEVKSQLQRVAEWIAGLRYTDIPDRVITLAKWQFLDALTAICAGSRSTIGCRLRGVFAQWDPGGACTALPHGERWSWENTTYYHAALINALELDHFTFMGHIGQSAVAATLTLSEKLDADGKDFLVALIAAQEVGGRMGGYLATGPQQGHMRAFIHRAAGAVAACKLSGADAQTTARAMAIALSGPEFPLYPASFSPDTKVTCTSAPTVEGVRSALLAMHGLDASIDIVEHPVGLIAFFSYLSVPPDIWGQIGKSWTPYSLSFKKYASCAYAQGPVNAAVRIREQLGEIDPAAIDKVVIDAPLVSVVMETFSLPHQGTRLTPVNTQFSNRRSVALALLFGGPTGDFYRRGHFETHTAAIHQLAEKTELHHDWQLTIDMIRAVDGGIRGAGRPGVLSLGASAAAMDQFRKAFGSRPLFQWQDVPELLRISAADRRYLLRRFWRAYRPRLPFRSREERSAYCSSEGDLEQMFFALGGRVRLHLKNGQTYGGECRVPSGFAGDPARLAVAEAKYDREVTPVWGKEKAERVKAAVMQLPAISVRALLEHGAR